MNHSAIKGSLPYRRHELLGRSIEFAEHVVCWGMGGRLRVYEGKQKPRVYEHKREDVEPFTVKVRVSIKGRIIEVDGERD